MHPPRQPNYTVHVQEGEQSSSTGRISSFTPETIDVDFDLDQAPAFPLGVAVAVSMERGEVPTRFVAQVVVRRELDGNRRFTLRVAEPAVLAFLGARDLRAAARVRPSEGEPIEVHLYLGGQAPLVRGQLYDLSNTGIAASFAPEEEPRLHQASEVSVRFTLPNEKKSVRLVGHIRNRVLQEGGIRYGILFDESASLESPEQIQAIQRYVRRRQIEELQVARDLLASQEESSGGTSDLSDQAA